MYIRSLHEPPPILFLGGHVWPDTGMAEEKGPTRMALQPQCVVPPVSEVRNLRGYFQATRQLLLQGEQYYTEGNLVHVSAWVGGWVSVSGEW